MPKFDFSTFKVWVTQIYALNTLAKGLKPPQRDYKKYNLLMNAEEEKTPEEIEFLRKFDEKIAVLNDPPLAKTTISAIVRQYGWLVYGKKVADKGDPIGFLKKGTDMESEAAELLSRIDKKKYSLQTETIENEYLRGRCDILYPEGDKIIDTKISWNVNAFLASRMMPLQAKHWYQMQGYMELYNVNQAEVVYLLLNTPPELIEREKIKLVNRFMIGEIDREKYELDLENIESAFTYNSLPMKKRHFRYKVNREPQIFEKIYKKVEKVRIWMQEFEQEMKTNVFVVPSEKYLAGEKNNTEPESNESLSLDEG